jgi:hypothetical protein
MKDCGIEGSVREVNEEGEKGRTWMAETGVRS